MIKEIFNSLRIKTKLILLFTVVKIIPVIFIAYIALIGINSLHSFFKKSSEELRGTAKSIVTSTSNIAVQDSIKALDKRTQTSLEILTAQIAGNVANFLYERDNDIKFLSTIEPDDTFYKTFINTKQRDIAYINPNDFKYDNETSSWKRKQNAIKEKVYQKANLEDNQKKFHRVDTETYIKKKIPIYKEITFFDLSGKEKIKFSFLEEQKKDISIKSNTYLKAEDYFQAISSLKKGEIYVSDVIGEYVPSRIIGTFTKEKAKKAGISFEPKKHAYAGKENPNGKRFEGIIRFVTPVFSKNKKIGYITLALDHRHIMEFTDTINPLKYSKVDIPNAGDGNYAFMWDYKARNISHPRDYFIVGFDKETGQRVPPWISIETQSDFEKSSVNNLNEFLSSYPTYHNQSLQQKANLAQIKQGQLALDCRYLNFAPQCQGWMQLTENGGVGSFVIFWSKVWKLTTASVIPYHTGQYGTTQRGFGFVTLGANVEEFQKAANEIKDNLNTMLDTNFVEIDSIMDKTIENIENSINLIVNELSYFAIAMILLIIFIAIWLSNLLKNRLNKLLLGAREFANQNFSYRIKDDSKDELGELTNAFNDMLSSLEEYIKNENDLKLSLEDKVNERTTQLTTLNSKIQKELFIKLKQEKKLKIFAEIFKNTSEAIIVTDKEGNVLQVNEAFTKITQYEEKDAIGKPIGFLRSHRHNDKFFEKMWKRILSKEIWESEIWNYKADGSLYPALISIIPILNYKNEITNFVSIQHDITNIKKNEEALHQQAYYDTLTKLANRSLGYERLKHAIDKAKISQHKVAILFLDLDKFKYINDTMGHDMGDLLLIQVAQRLIDTCSKSDTVCRLGGDEFLIILEEIKSYDEAIISIENIINDIATPFIINNKTIQTSASIGVTFYPDDGVESNKLLKNADIAMYRAKNEGRNTFEIFTKELNDQFKESVKLEESIKQGIKNNEFYMVYQPIYDIKSKQIVGFEALMRWKHENKIHSPAIFMDILENTRLIVDVTYNILVDSLQFVKNLNEELDKNFFITINISQVQFALPSFHNKLLSNIKLSGLSPHNICLEVTESIFLDKIEDVSLKLEKIKKHGVSIALDDFGTGYSSLQYIKSLPIDKIKLDRSFIQGLPDSKGDKAIINSISSLAENFSLKLIAEGVETEEQLKYLQDMQCDFAQGFLLSKPKTKEEIRALLH